MPIVSQVISNNTSISNYDIRIIDCIALCNIVDKFEEFTKNLKEFSKGTFGDVKLNSLYNYVKNEDAFVRRYIKTFYQNNKDVLDTIHKYSYISNFLLIYFDNKTGKFNQEISQMYEYIKANKEDIDKILAVLGKLKELGFENFCFDSTEKFDDTYQFDFDDLYFYFVDGNIEIIPSMDGLKYKSNDANYEIKMGVLKFSEKEITLNNLVFDSNKLPNKINVNELKGRILELKNKNIESFNVLRDAVHTNYYLEKIVLSIDKMDEIIGSIHNCKDKDLAKKYIDNTKQNITDLQLLLEIYEKDLIDQGLLSEKVLEEEKLKHYRTYK